jgi:2-keto-4-pentenoate hydratase/2-oxohepta-3-ene-1,7-dioic acid hydratase in catechol pathway
MQMRLASVQPDNLAVVQDNSFVLIGDILTDQGALGKDATMIGLISQYDSIKESIAKAISRGRKIDLDPHRLKPPVETPSKIWAAAGNYRRGSGGLDDARGRGASSDATPQELLERIFLKPPSAITGPEQAIVIPEGAKTIFPELELCVVIGKKTRNISKADALDAVFGYTIILDVTARGYGSGKGLPGTRCVRKGFETFAPIGPWIATKEEIKDPENLTMRLWVNDELRQMAKTDAMVNNIATLVSYLSQVTTFYPGDLIATGNPDAPEFQKQLAPGDRLKAEIESIGAMSLTVEKEV